MANSELTVSQIALATTDTEAMVKFYTTTFATTFQPIVIAGTTLYRSALHNIPFVLCPNSLANVQAERSRHQFTYTVGDLSATIARALAGGGVVDREATGHDEASSITVRDPDGNSLVFTQA